MIVWRLSSRSPRGWTVGLAGLLAVVAANAVTPGRAVAAPQFSLDERARAIASPSLVYLERIITGYLRDKKTGATVETAAITVNRPCTGFVVNSDGYVVTNGLCIQPTDETIRQSALYVLGRALIHANQLDAKDLDDYVARHMNSTVFTGKDPASAPDSKTYGQLNAAKGNLTAAPAVTGEIVRVTGPDEGNVALVKLAKSALPAVELEPSAKPAAGTSLTVLGYDTGDADPRTGTYTLRSKSVEVTGTGVRGTVTEYRLDSDIGIYARGGMAIDNTGRVVGVLDNDQALPSNAVRAVIPASTVAAMLSAAGVSNTLSASDRLYRSGLDAYFAGDYATAISDLNTVATDMPTNQVARTYRQNAVNLRHIDSGSTGTPTWLPLVAAGAGGGLVVALVILALVMLRRSRRRKVRSSLPQPYQFPPVSAAPMSGAPISGAAISGAPMSGAPLPGAPVPSGPPYPPRPAPPLYYGEPINGVPANTYPTSPGAGYRPPTYYPPPGSPPGPPPGSPAGPPPGVLPPDAPPPEVSPFEVTQPSMIEPVTAIPVDGMMFPEPTQAIWQVPPDPAAHQPPAASVSPPPPVNWPVQPTTRPTLAPTNEEFQAGYHGHDARPVDNAQSSHADVDPDPPTNGNPWSPRPR